MDFDLDIVNPEEQEEGLESSESLRRHLIIQTGEKLNEFKQCKFACSHQITLRRHLKKHSGEKSNKCNQCEFACSIEVKLFVRIIGMSLIGIARQAKKNRD